MTTRTLEQWKEIIEQQKASDLTIIDFCEQNDINLKTFYNRRAKLGLSPEKAKPAFIKAKSVTINKSAGLSLTLGDATLSLPRDTSPQWIAELLKAMAA